MIRFKRDFPPLLVSHRKKFIFIKTRKTAGTSVEIYLERWCLPPDEDYVETPGRDETITPAGIIGYRGPQRAPSMFYNHMTAAEIRALLPPDMWESYLKIACVRNPYDQAVSMFWFRMSPERREALQDAPFSEVKAAFSEWLPQAYEAGRNGASITIDGQSVLDDVIRHESLSEDLERICSRLDIPIEPERLGSYKGGQRKRPEHFSDYYGPEETAFVTEQCKFEIETFGYGAMS